MKMSDFFRGKKNFHNFLLYGVSIKISKFFKKLDPENSERNMSLLNMLFVYPFTPFLNLLLIYTLYRA